MPFSDKARSRFDLRLSWGCDPPIALELGGESRQRRKVAFDRPPKAIS